MNIELRDIQLKCSECGAEATGQEINEDTFRFYTFDGDLVSLPSHGITLDEAYKVGSMKLFCECCQEDRDESY